MSSVYCEIGAVILTENGAATTYCTVSEADAYHQERLHNSEWLQTNSADKLKALKWATNILDTMSWKGEKTFQYNKLRWPRKYVKDQDGFTIDSTIFPEILKNATAEYAWELIKRDRDVDSDNAGISRVKAGEVEVEFDKHDRPTKVPTRVMFMLSSLVNSGWGASATLVRV